jgi:hypothetical protein
MRFCPFCGGENGDDAATCAVCGRKLPAAVRRPTTAAAGPAVPAAGTPAPTSVQPRSKTPSIPPPIPAGATPRKPSGPIVVPSPSAPIAPAPPLPPPNGNSNGNGQPVAAAGKATPIGTPTNTPVERSPTDSALATRLVALPEVDEVRRSLPQMPAVPDGGPFDWARYAVLLEIARFKRRRAIKLLGGDVVKDTASLDGVLGELGRAARAAHVDGRVYADENQALDEAERRRAFAEQACADLTAKKAEENAKFEAIQHDLAARLSEREETLKLASAELDRLDGQRRALREKKRDLERKQKAIYKSAEEREEQASRSQMGDSRQALRQAASELRREAGKLEGEKQELDGRLGGIEKPLSDAQARTENAKGEAGAARRDLENAREGHRHRVAEIEAEQARRSRELTQAESEIARRLVTLGTILNLNRVNLPAMAPLYEKADELRGAISARETEIDRLEAEREQFDHPSRLRGFAVLGVALVALVTLVWVALAIIV